MSDELTPEQCQAMRRDAEAWQALNCSSGWDVRPIDRSYYASRLAEHVLTLLAALEAREADVARVRAGLRAAESALRIVHRDLCEWRQFARYNAAGVLCGEQVGLPDPPQRPTIAGLNVTDQNIAMIEDFLASIAELTTPDAKGSGNAG